MFSSKVEDRLHAAAAVGLVVVGVLGSEVEALIHWIFKWAVAIDWISGAGVYAHFIWVGAQGAVDLVGRRRPDGRPNWSKTYAEGSPRIPFYDKFLQKGQLAMSEDEILEPWAFPY